MKMHGRWALPALVALAVGACGGDGGETGGEMAMDTSSTAVPAGGEASVDTGMAAAPTGPVTVAMRDASGRDLGTLTATESGQGITLAGTLRGLAPGEHGIHVHAVGKCEPPFDSAGPHWNPTSKQHGTENPQGPHLGDMSNLTAGADSTATVNVTTPGGTLRGPEGMLDADGASVVVHASADDYRTDPSGNSGARIACGVVQAS